MFTMPDCNILVTCCNINGGLYHLQIKDNKYSLRKLLNKECRGIVKYKDHFVLVTATSILRLDSAFNIVKQKQVPGYDCHGLAIHEDKLYIVESRFNCIGIYNIAHFQRVGEVAFSHKKSDVNHINDLFIDNNRMFISMFSHIKPWRQTVQHSGVILECSLLDNTKKRLHQSNLTHPHSVIFRKGKLYYCNSGRFEVRENSKVIFTSSGYTRGLAFYSDKFLFVGQSESRNAVLTAKNLTNTSDIRFKCGIQAYDCSLKDSRFIPLPSKEVNSIRKFCSEYKSNYDKLDILIHNAAYFNHGEKYQLSPNNIELTFATNTFGPFLMTTLLSDYLKKAPYADDTKTIDMIWDFSTKLTTNRHTSIK
jgi:hypothetical protein